MSGKLKTAKLLILIAALFCLSGCTTFYNPATQRKESLFIDTPAEVAMGKDMDKEVQKKYKIEDNVVMQSRLDKIGAKVAAVSDRTDLTYHFAVVKDKDFNAFTIPGGFIYVHSGLMEAASDDELACVLAHEIGHVAARHTVKRLQADLGYQIVAAIALGASGQQTMGRAMGIVFNLASLGYSRQDENLADKLAVKYAKTAGFNPYGMVTFFEKLKKESDKKGPQFNLVFLSSHPPIEERIKNVKNEIALIKETR